MRSRSVGFSLIEVLVSTVILSIGLLGVAALQLAGLQYSQAAYQQSQATVAAADLIDRMRANPDLDTASGIYTFTSMNAGSATAATKDCDGSGCAATELAQYDVAQWLNQVLPALGPGASASVQRTGDTYTVTVNWSDVAQRDGSGDAVQRTMQTEVRL